MDLMHIFISGIIGLIFFGITVVYWNKNNNDEKPFIVLSGLILSSIILFFSGLKILIYVVEDPVLYMISFLLISFGVISFGILITILVLFFKSYIAKKRKRYIS